MEENAKDCTFIVATNKSSSQSYDGTSDCSDRSSISCKSDDKSMVKALEFEIQRLIPENKYQRMLLQIFDEKECEFKEEISNLKFQL